MMGSPQNGLDVAVIGAGIAGLAAGICLRRAGHSVTIHERSEFKNEVGAAINMPPHAVRILRTWGLAQPEPINGEKYSDIAFGSKLYGSRRRDPVTTGVVRESRYDGDELVYGACATSYHRADLHSGLRHLAEEAGARIDLGQTILDVDPKTGTVTLTDTAAQSIKKTIQKDLIVLADGVRTSFVEAVTGQNIPLIQSGKSTYRMLIPTQKLLEDPETAPLFHEDGYHFASSTIDPHAGVFFVMYPCRNNELMNVAIFHQPTVSEKDKHDWNSPADISDVVASLEGFHPAYKAIVEHADNVRVYALADRAPLSTYVNGRVVMIGDAAHPMLPTVAGGGTTSLEDAVALEVVLGGMKSSDSIDKLSQRLALFDALRVPRNSMTQVISQGLVSPKPAIELADQVRHFYTGNLPKETIAGSTPETREFIYHYDAYQVSKIALQWAEEEGYPEDMMLRMQRESVVKHFGR